MSCSYRPRRRRSPPAYFAGRRGRARVSAEVSPSLTFSRDGKLLYGIRYEPDAEIVFSLDIASCSLAEFSRTRSAPNASHWRGWSPSKPRPHSAA